MKALLPILFSAILMSQPLLPAWQWVNQSSGGIARIEATCYTSSDKLFAGGTLFGNAEFNGDPFPCTGYCNGFWLRAFNRHGGSIESFINDPSGTSTLSELEEISVNRLAFAGWFSGSVLNCNGVQLDNISTEAFAADVFVGVIDYNLGEPELLTAIGGSGDEILTGMDTDADGSLYLCGTTTSLTLQIGTQSLAVPPNSYGISGFLIKLKGSGIVDWAKFASGPLYPYINDVSVHNGSVVICGDYTSFNLSDSLQLENLSFPVNYQQNTYIIGMRNDGVITWSHYWAGEGEEHLSDVEHDANGYIYACGSMGTPGTSIGNSSYPGQSSEYYDAMLLKLSASGEPIWTRFTPESEYGQMMRVAPYGNGKVLVYGYFTSDSLAFLGQQVMIQDTSHYLSNQDYLVNYSHSGEVEWIKKVGTSANQNVFALSVASNGDAYMGVIGDVSYPVVLDSIGLQTNGFMECAYLTKLGIPESNTGFEEYVMPVKLYPNPVIDHLQLDLPFTLNNSRLTVYNSIGGVKEIRIAEDKMTLDCSSYTPGLYYLQFLTGTEVINASFLIVR
jgi:hypothetical protein